MNPRQHRIADRLGAAWADGGGRSRSSRRSRAESAIWQQRTGADGFWSRRLTPAAVFRACSICAITATRIFPLWALARYRNLKANNSAAVPFGM